MLDTYHPDRPQLKHSGPSKAELEPPRRWWRPRGRRGSSLLEGSGAGWRRDHSGGAKWRGRGGSRRIWWGKVAAQPPRWEEAAKTRRRGVRGGLD